MGNNIKGITIEIGGKTTELQASLKSATDKGKEAATEISKINKSLNFNPENVVLLGQKMDVLKERVSAAEEKLDTLKKVQGQVEEQFKNGDISADKYRAFQREIIEAESTLENFKKQLYDTTTEFKNSRSIIGKVENAYNDFKDKVENVKDRHSKLVTVLEKTKSVAGVMAKGELKLLQGATEGTAAAMAGLIAGGVGVANKLLAISEETKELRDNLGKLETAFVTNELTAEQSKDTYVDLYAVLGDSDKATETAAHIAAMADSEKELTEWTKICTGVYGKFGDSLPTEALAEAANETSKTGKLTGTLADALNWAGVNEEDFQAKLDACSTEQERQALITETLNGLYSESADKFREVNDTLIKAQEAQANYSLSLAGLGDAVDDIKNNAMAEFLPGITEVVDGLTALLSGDEGAPELIKKGIEDITAGIENFVPEITGILTDFTNTISEITPEIITTFINGILDNLDSIVEAAFDMLEALAEGLLDEENLEKLVGAAVSLVTSLVGFLGNNAGLLIDSAFVIIESLIDGLLNDENADKLIHSALDIITAIVTGLVDNAPEIVTGAFSLIGALIDALLSYDWWQVAKDILEGIKDGLRSLISGEVENNDDYDKPKPKAGGGSHAGGLAYVPYDGYSPELHEGERILTAAENRNYNRQKQEQAAELETLNRRIDALAQSSQSASKRPINIIATGSAGAIARSLNYYVEEEDERAGVIDKK